MNIITYDIGGTNIKGGFFQNHKLVNNFEIKAHSQENINITLNLIKKSIQELLYLKKIDSINGIGIAFAGLVDSKNMKVIGSNGKYLDAHKVNFKHWAKKEFKSDFIIENDARLACIGEWQYGVGKDCNNFVNVTLGTGIGTSTIINGKVLRGKNFQAGVLGGHFTLDINGFLCNCGNIGCAESLASSWNLNNIILMKAGSHNKKLREYNSKYENMNFKEIFIAADKNIKVAKIIRDYCLDIWSHTIINLIHAYDPEKIILTGGILNGYPNFIKKYIQNKLDNFTWIQNRNVKVLVGKNINTAGLWGLEYLLTSDPNLSVML